MLSVTRRDALLGLPLFGGANIGKMIVDLS
jgi:hypothetical protein